VSPVSPQIFFLARREQDLYAAWRSQAVDEFIRETKRIKKSWCAANTYFAFADNLDTTKTMVTYTAIPYGRKGYEQIRPKLSAAKLARLQKKALSQGMSVDSNAFFCTAVVQKN